MFPMLSQPIHNCPRLWRCPRPSVTSRRPPSGHAASQPSQPGLWALGQGPGAAEPPDHVARTMQGRGSTWFMYVHVISSRKSISVDSLVTSSRYVKQREISASLEHRPSSVLRGHVLCRAPFSHAPRLRVEAPPQGNLRAGPGRLAMHPGGANAPCEVGLDAMHKS